MRNAKPMKLSSTGIWKLFWIVLLCLPGWKEMHAQDPLPEQPPHDKNSGPVYSSSEMQKLMRFVEVEDPMPASFRNTQENRIDDPTGSLNAFWESLQRLDRPVRIVHIGDSHVRGHVFPYIMRKALEADFGSEAVVDQPVTYRSSGLAQETGVSGIVYHIMGINGATCASFSTPENLHAVAGLDPDLIIVSFGTNEAHGRKHSHFNHCKHLGACLNRYGKEVFAGRYASSSGLCIGCGGAVMIGQVKFYEKAGFQNILSERCYEYLVEKETIGVQIQKPMGMLLRFLRMCLANGEPLDHASKSAVERWNEKDINESPRNRNNGCEDFH